MNRLLLNLEVFTQVLCGWILTIAVRESQPLGLMLYSLYLQTDRYRKDCFCLCWFNFLNVAWYTSQTLPCLWLKFGVPQGCVLRPQLFTSYIAEEFDVTSDHCSCSCWSCCSLYAMSLSRWCWLAALTLMVLARRSVRVLVTRNCRQVHQPVAAACH